MKSSLSICTNSSESEPKIAQLLSSIVGWTAKLVKDKIVISQHHYLIQLFCRSLQPTPFSVYSRLSDVKMQITAAPIESIPTLPFVIPGGKFQHQSESARCSSVGLNLRTQFLPFNSRGPKSYAICVKHTSVICSAALNATCAAGQTQTVTRESPTITIAPVSGKEKSPDLDDGGTGFPPRDDGGGGGGGGGGNNFSGGFFFFGFLAFLGFLKDRENEEDYRDDIRR